jgi:hypothetical protein
MNDTGQPPDVRIGGQATFPEQMTWDEARRWIGLLIALLGAVGLIVLIVALWLNRLDSVLTELVLKN